MGYLENKLTSLWNNDLVKTSLMSSFAFLALSIYLKTMGQFDLLSWAIFFTLGVFIADVIGNNTKNITMSHVVAVAVLTSLSYDIFGVLIGEFVVSTSSMLIKAVELGLLAWIVGSLFGVKSK